ncbi:MAG: hypothetical protein LBD64_07980 [Odoribacteraceae bacterium]|nr:hypothetical protein [Odoribacteraceae bacterium]
MNVCPPSRINRALYVPGRISTDVVTSSEEGEENIPRSAHAAPVNKITTAAIDVQRYSRDRKRRAGSTPHHSRRESKRP